jgi:hypothetical protein
MEQAKHWLQRMPETHMQTTLQPPQAIDIADSACNSQENMSNEASAA